MAETLSTSRRGTAVIAAGNGALAAASLLLLAMNHQFAGQRMVGTVGLVFFGLGFLVTLAIAIRPLKIAEWGPDGLSVDRGRTVPWHAIRRMEVREIRGAPYLAIWLHEPYASDKLVARRGRWLRRVERDGDLTIAGVTLTREVLEGIMPRLEKARHATHLDRSGSRGH
jgi:hypothetical protein